jgi:uncharacterized membrane protein YdjX (TVP38/TMEM64 family)
VARRLAVLCLIALLAVAWWRGWLEGFDAQVVGSLVRDAGAWGPALFVLLFSLGNGLGAPGFLFVFPAAAVWPPWEAFLLSWLGAIGAGLVGYAFARSIGRSFVEAHLSQRMRSLDRRIEQHALRSVAAVRFTFFLSTPVHWALGLTSVSLRPLLLGSALGFAPPTALWVFAGREILEAIQQGSSLGWLGLLLLIAVSLAVPYWLSRRRAEARRQRPEP